MRREKRSRRQCASSAVRVRVRVCVCVCVWCVCVVCVVCVCVCGVCVWCVCVCVWCVHVCAVCVRGVCVCGVCVCVCVCVCVVCMCVCVCVCVCGVCVCVYIFKNIHITYCTSKPLPPSLPPSSPAYWTCSLVSGLVSQSETCSVLSKGWPSSRWTSRLSPRQISPSKGSSKSSRGSCGLVEGPLSNMSSNGLCLLLDCLAPL